MFDKFGKTREGLFDKARDNSTKIPKKRRKRKGCGCAAAHDRDRRKPCVRRRASDRSWRKRGAARRATSNVQSKRGRPPRHHRSRNDRWRLPPALHRMFSRSAAVRRATIEVETTAGVSASAPSKSNRCAALSFECYKRKMETVWLQNNSYCGKPILWHDTRFFCILRSHCWILRSHWWIGREHLYFPSGIGL